MTIRQNMFSAGESRGRKHGSKLYRARDLLLWPSLLSLTRIPLAAAFPLVVGEPVAALAVLVLAGFSDVLDGWVARRYGLATATGALVDPISDKLFVITVVITLNVTGYLSLPAIVLLSTREIGELPLVLWFALSPAARGRQSSERPSANIPGKLATTLQFATVAWALFHGALLNALLIVTAAAGVFAAFCYFRRTLRVFVRA